MVFVDNNPILLFVGSVPNSVVALTEIVDKNGNDVIVIVRINKSHKRNVINKIASVYSKSDEQGNNKTINYVKQQIDAGNLVTKSGVTRIGGRHLSKMETEALFLIDRTFRKYGIHCVAIDGLTDENGHAVNALLTKKDVIVLNLNADGGLLSVAAGHELFHWLKKNDKNSAEYLQNLVIAMLKADKNVDFDALYKQRANVYTDLNENELLEEIAAQYFGVVFSSESNIRKVVNEATDVEKGILRKIVGRLKSFIKNLKAALKEYGIIDKTVRAAVESDIGELEEMVRLFDVALSEAAKNKKPTTDEGGVKYSKQKPKKNSAKSKKSYYNETETILMIWANSESTPVGSVLRQRKKGKLQFFLKTATGVLSIDKYEYEKIVSKENEYVRELNIIRKRNGDADSVIYADPGRGSSGDVHYDGYTGDAEGSNTADEKSTEKELESGSFGDMANDGQHNSEISKDISSALQSQRSGYKFSRQLTAETEAGIEQMKLENESFFQYLDRLGNSIGQKIKEKRTPRSSLVYDREAFYDIAGKYNLLDSKSGGLFKSSKYSDTELVNVMENIMVGISDELISPEAGLSRLARIQEEILKTGYELKYGKDLNGVEIKAETAKAFKQDIRNKPIYVSRYTFSKLMEQYGTKRNLRAASFHQLSVKEEDGDNAPNVELIYGEIQKKYPNLLNLVTEPLDMINELISTERAIRPEVEYISEKEGFKGFLDLSEAAVRRAADMLTEAFNIELKQGDLQAQYKELRGVRQTLDRTKKYYRDLLNDSAKIRAEREQKAILAKRILRVSRRLDKLLRKETDTKHIPEGLKEPVAKFLQIIKGSITNSFGESLIDTSLSLAELNKAYEAYGYEDTMHPDESYAEKLSQLQFVLQGNKRLKDLSLGELETVEEIVTHINYLVNEGNKTFVDMQKRGYEHVASVSTEEVFAHKEERKKGLEKIKDFDYKNLTPYMFFKRIGTRFEGSEEVTEVLGELGNALFKGEEKTARNVEQVKKKTQEIMKTWGYDSRWLSDKRDFVFESGQKVSMTTENIMNVLATYDREEASGFKTDHILAGGIVVNESSHKTVSDYIKPLPETIKTRYLFNKARKERKERLKNNKIFVGMTDAERAKVLKETALEVVDATDVEFSEDINDQTVELEKKTKGQYFDFVRTLGKNIGIFKDYLNENINIEFNYSIGSTRESVDKLFSQKGDRSDYIKMLSVFDEVVKNAQLIEVHEDKYKGTKKENTNLRQAYVLMSAFQDGNNLIPVEFVVKEFKVGVKNQLYVSVNLKRIEAGVPKAGKNNPRNTFRPASEAEVMKAVEPKSPDAFRPTSIFRLTDIISNVNPLDSEFLKYIPASMLDEQQIVGRNEGIRKEKLRIAEIERTGEVNVSAEVTEDEQRALAEKIAESMRVYISKKDIDMLKEQLTPIQIGYYKALVREMSEHGADMGNEVSMLLHGTKKYNEENYCPVTAVNDYLLERFGNKDVGERRLKNRSFTKRLTENANVPILIDNMSEVYAKHMYEMCTYNGMTLPLESIERLLNYKLPDEYERVGDKIQIKKGKSYRELFREAFGDRGLNYLENLMKDLNGGIKTDDRGALNSMITNFKRSAVSASLTVAFQQPGAVARAMFRISPKYFTLTVYMPLLDKVTGKYTDYFDRYDELLKYCPLAVIKDIGKFDTNVGQSYEEWILDVKPRFRRSIKEVNRNILENAALRHREREERNIIINRIQRNVNRFSDMIRNESDKRHIPTDIKEDVQKFINLSVHTNSNGRPTFHQGDTLNMNSLHYAYKDILLSKDDEGKEISLPFYDQYIADALENLGKKYGNSLDIKQLNSEELIMSDRIVCHISHIIKYKNDIFIDGRRQDAVKWSNEVLKEMDKHNQKDSYPFVLPGLNAEYGMLTPIYFFKNIATHYDGDSVIKEYAHDEDYCQRA